MISALVVMCVSFVVPASALDYNTFDPDNSILSLFDETWGWKTSKYIIVKYNNVDYTSYRPTVYAVYALNPSSVYYDNAKIVYNANAKQFYFDNYKYTGNNDVMCLWRVWGEKNGTLHSNGGYVCNSSKDSLSPTGESAYLFAVSDDISIYCSDTVYDFNDREKVISSDPSAIPAPYTVTYSPELKLGLTRKTSEYETKSIDITLTLNKDYLDWYIRRKSEWVLDQSCGKFEQYDIKTCLDTAGANIDIIDCAKSKAIYFISLSDTSKSLKTVTGNSVYTYLTEQRYSIVDKQSGKIDGSTSTATYANGLYPYFTINFNDQYKKASFYDNLTYSNYQSLCSNLPSYTFSIPLENINAEKFETISALNSILTCEYTFDYDKMFENSSQSTFSKSYKEKYNVDRGPKGVSFTNDDNWNDDTTGYADYFSKSDCYTVYSEKFSFDSYPDYVPIKDNDGNEIDNIKHNPFDLALNPVKPNSYQSVDKDGNLSEKRTEDEQIKYDKDFKYSHNFANVDYTDFSSIFSTSSSYFEFLTASIRILPDWFIATFTAWFITFLTLALIKYVIQ